MTLCPFTGPLHSHTDKSSHHTKTLDSTLNHSPHCYSKTPHHRCTLLTPSTHTLFTPWTTPSTHTIFTPWVTPSTHTPFTQWLHTSVALSEKKAVVEKAVDSAKEKKKKSMSSEAGSEQGGVVKPQEGVAKPSLAKRIWNEVLHYYHGFRLLALDTRVAARLLWKTVRGHSLTRREQKQVGGCVGVSVCGCGPVCQCVGMVTSIVLYSFAAPWLTYSVFSHSLCLL